MTQESLEKKTFGTDEAEAFVREAGYEAGETPLACCVDGRYGADDRAAAAAPGADAGKMLEACAALRELGFALDHAARAEVLEAVVESVGGRDRFRFHTDAHAEESLRGKAPEEKIARGCGHVRLASENPGAYHLTAADVADIFAKLAELKSGEVVLEGGHAEAAVVVATDLNRGLAHQGSEGQAFVYHAAWDEVRLKRLAEKLAALPAVREAGLSAERIEEALQSVASLQRNLTLAKLAKGLPIFEAGESVRKVGQVE